jgi:hypothetical protein
LLVSSHLLAEVAQPVDDVVIIAGGEMRGRGTLAEVLGGDEGTLTEVRSQDPERLASALEQHGHRLQCDADSLLVLGTSPADVGLTAIIADDFTEDSVSELFTADFSSWRNLVVAALLGAFGVCVGGIVRNQIVAIVGLLVLAFALEPALLSLARDVGQFGPTTGAPSGIIGVNPVGEEELLEPAVALVVMIGWVALGFGVTAALLRRRDLV